MKLFYPSSTDLHFLVVSLRCREAVAWNHPNRNLKEGEILRF